jgi:hypothetical protein
MSMIHFGSIQYYFLFVLGIDQMTPPFCFHYLGTSTPAMSIYILREICAFGSNSTILFNTLYIN